MKNVFSATTFNVETVKEFDDPNSAERFGVPKMLRSIYKINLANL